MNSAPQLLKGFRDFLPKEKIYRDRVMEKITSSFSQFGFEPIETPTLEYRDTIMGKYGDEADKLVYAFEDNGGRSVAMRYDQTVPTARFIAAHQNDIVFPFKRYQTQNVFRADKPQKGRFREFTQCDIDIFGSTHPLADAEILACTYAAYCAIGFPTVRLLVNDRQSLLSLLEPFAVAGVDVFSIIQTIDKLDKLPASAVVEELTTKGMAQANAQGVLQAIEGATISPALVKICDAAERMGVPKASLVYSPALARGLDYYTGMIFEVRIDGYNVGSVGGGGRYDNLIEQLCGISVPAVGMAFGFDRTVEAARELGLLQDGVGESTVLMTIFDASTEQESIALSVLLREQGVSVSLYPGVEKLSKQLKYADKKRIRFALVVGPDEIGDEVVLIKDMQTGAQDRVSRDALLTTLQARR